MRPGVPSLVSLAVAGCLALLMPSSSSAESAAKFKLLGYPEEEALLLSIHPQLYAIDRHFELQRHLNPEELTRTLGQPRLLKTLEIYTALLRVRGDTEAVARVDYLIEYISRLPKTSKSARAIELYLERVDRYSDEIRMCNEDIRLPETLIKAIIIQESTGNPTDVSRAGALGLMQLMPDTARAMGVRNPFNPYENICGGIRYFKMMLDRFNWDVNLALAAYNAGPDKVVAYNGIPPYRETQDYVRSVRWIKQVLDRYARL